MKFEIGAMCVAAAGLVFWAGFAAGHADPDRGQRSVPCVSVTSAVDAARVRLDDRIPCERAR